nr:hypothetical protein [Labrys wisconsinensis]
MTHGVIERERQGCQGLAAAGRHRHREQAGRRRRERQRVVEDVGAKGIQSPLRFRRRPGTRLLPLDGHVGTQPIAQRGQGRAAATLDRSSLRPLVERRRLQPVRVDETGKDHAREEGEAEAAFAAREWPSRWRQRTGRGQRAGVSLPSVIGGRFLGEPRLERIAVGQTGVVAGDDEGEKSAEAFAEQSQRFARAGG